MITATHAINRNFSPSRAVSATAREETAAKLTDGEERTTLSDRSQRFLAARGLSAQERSDLDGLLARAAEQNAAQDPVAYLMSLGADQRALLQKAHGLAEPFKTSELSREGAANLLRYPGDGLDTDNDGFVSCGQARLFQFPPCNAPSEVKEAWDQATAGMSDLERVSAEGMFRPLMLRVDDAGNVTPIQVGDADYVAPYSGVDFSYTELVRQRLETLEVTFKYGKISDVQYTRDKSFLQRFGDALAERGMG